MSLLSSQKLQLAAFIIGFAAASLSVLQFFGLLAPFTAAMADIPIIGTAFTTIGITSYLGAAIMVILATGTMLYIQTLIKRGK